VLAASNGSGKVAYDSAVQALTNVHQSISDMRSAVDAFESQRPEDRVIGPKGNVMYVIPEARKEEVRTAMAQSFGRGSKRLDEAAKTIATAEGQLQIVIDGKLTNPRRNETSVAAVASEIRGHVKGLPTNERTGFVRRMMPLDAMLCYKQLTMVEQTFRTAKSLFATRPIFHKVDETIRGHVSCSFLALVLKKELEERIADLGRKGSWPDILADLDSLTETKVEQDDKCFLMRSPPRPAASLALSATGVALPPTVRQVDQA
jgi:hypothetical protein